MTGWACAGLPQAFPCQKAFYKRGLQLETQVDEGSEVAEGLGIKEKDAIDGLSDL